MRYLLLAALVLLAAAPLATGGNPRGLAQLERAIKAEVNGGPHGPVARTVRCRPNDGVARCVVTSVRGTELRARVPVGDDVQGLVWEPLSG